MVRCVTTGVDELRDVIMTFLRRSMVSGRGVLGRNCATDIYETESGLNQTPVLTQGDDCPFADCWAGMLK